MLHPVALALDLIRFDTVSPPGSEEACASYLAGLLDRAGFVVIRHDFAPRRTSIIARLTGRDAEAPALAFTGHLDTVPLGARAWSVDPQGELRDGRLYGRGASDMKGGVAAFVVAAIEAAASNSLRRGLTLILTAGEETGCRGARHLAEIGVLGSASGLVVAEPTANRLALAHKGALHLRARTAGRTAHGSMPQLGDNAVMKAVRAATALNEFTFGVAAHPLLGEPTATVTSLQGGEAVNVVPDACAMTVDIRTLPGQQHGEILRALAARLGSEIVFDTPLADLPAVGTDPDSAFARCASEVLAEVGGRDAAPPLGMPYFTDGSVLQPALDGCPTLIVGPGEPGQAHQTDEWCATQAIEAATLFYAALIRRWC
jgi:succinyl-diaminopimelate desuccinylase